MYRVYDKCGTKLLNKSYVKVLTSSRVLLKSTFSDLDAGYVPTKVEANIGPSNYFQPPLKSTECLKLILPPPNITGTLHLGHALTATIQDVIVRWKRMQGVKTTWIPGMDHAGIATQVVVEKKLWKENKLTRHDVGREEFERCVWKWKEQKGDVIGNQLRRLNVSLNWDEEVFTMDQPRSEAVTEAFIRLFEAGLIYRADHLVNWSCVLQSAISDIEVEHLNLSGSTDVAVPGYQKPVKFGVLTNFSYKLDNSDEEITVATTRPETMLGDVAVAVNPNDDRYSKYIGKRLWHPFRNETIPVIADEFVDVNFGTGAVKVTPAHDHTDFEVGKRHNLETVQVIDERGLMTDACGEFAGLRRFDVRDVLPDRLASLGLLKGAADHPMIVPICSRSKDVVEFLARPQWFIKCDTMAARAVEDVRQGRLTIEPPHFEKTWFNWLENSRDWCISRQLWWGHRIPAFECSVGDQKVWVGAKSSDEARAKASTQLKVAGEGISVRQDEDVLDTWFSSSLLPFSAFGWPKQTMNFSDHYPLSLMETGHDILFFWVARMVMLGTQLSGRLPFDRVLLHGIVCDAQGRKMSKSVGNVVAPEDVIQGSTLKELEAVAEAAHESGLLSSEELNRSVLGQRKMFPDGIPECGADALRFTLSSHNIKNHFINFDIKECHNNKLFGNKIWQATKFTKIWFDKVSQEQQLDKEPPFEDLHLMDKWILSRLDHMLVTAHENLQTYNFHLVTGALKNFLYFDFCDVYLESIKRGLRVPGSPGAAGHVWTLTGVLDLGLRSLAPFMPTLAEHLHRSLPLLGGRERSTYFPQPLNTRDEALEREVTEIMEVVVAIRRLKKIFNVLGKHQPQAHLFSNNQVFTKFLEVIEDNSACQVHVHEPLTELQLNNTIKDKVGDVTIELVVPEELLQSLVADLPKMEKKKEKLLKELEKMNKMISGSTYKVNATPEAQETHSKKIAGLEEKLSRINYIQNLAK